MPYFKLKKQLLFPTSTNHFYFLALLYGLATIGLGFVAEFMGKLLLQISMSIFGLVGGPLLGGILSWNLFPKCKQLGKFHFHAVARH